MSLPVTDGLVLDLDAAVLRDALNDGDAVEIWPDSSGEGNDATQSTANARPVFRKAGFGEWVHFDGSNDHLVHGYEGEPRTVFVVAFTEVNTSFRSLLGARSLAAGQGDAYYFQITNTGRHRFNRQASIANHSSDYGSAATGTFNWFLQSGTWNDTEILVRYNGVAGTPSSGSGTPNSIDGPAVVGAAYFNDAVTDNWDGGIRRVLIYDRVLDSEEIDEVEDYLFKLYGIEHSDDFDADGLPVTSGLVGWFKADDPAFAGLSDDSTIAFWPDRSGGSRWGWMDLVARWPTYQTNVQSGRPGIRFTRSQSDWINGNKVVHAVTGASGITAFEVRRPTSASLAMYSGFHASNGADRFVWGHDASGNVLAFGTSAVSDAAPYSLTDIHVLTARRDGSAINIRQNGTPVASGSESSTISSIARFSIGQEWDSSTGTSDHFDGHIFEVLVYARELSDSEVAQVEAYLAHKWEIEGVVTAVELEATGATGVGGEARIATGMPLEASGTTGVGGECRLQVRKQLAPAGAVGVSGASALHVERVLYVDGGTGVAGTAELRVTRRIRARGATGVLGTAELRTAAPPVVVHPVKATLTVTARRPGMTITARRPGMAITERRPRMTIDDA